MFTNYAEVAFSNEAFSVQYGIREDYQFNPGKATEISRKTQEGFLPIISQAPGFVAYYSVIEENDMGTSSSIFQSQAQAEESIRLAADWSAKHERAR